MLSFETFIDEISNIKDDPREFLLGFFTKENFKQYEVLNNPEKDELKAVKVMFESKKDLLKRCDQAIKYDPFCLEAFFVFFVLSEDIFVNYRFEAFYNNINEFADFNDYQKHNYLKIMEFYVEFLIDIHSFTKAIKVQKMIIRLSNNTSLKDIHRLSYLYYEIEDSDDFYRLYSNNDFDEYAYILLMLTLLKNDEELKAKEVLLEMYDKIEYGKYLDHLWDLDINDEKQKEFYKIVESCYQEISSVPGFFSWVNQIRENLK